MNFVIYKFLMVVQGLCFNGCAAICTGYGGLSSDCCADA